MSAKKPDIKQIGKYLQGELDARAMHKLERKAQDDPFLAEAMDGFEAAAADQQANYADLQERLAQRIAPAKERNIWLWRVLPLAACLLIALLIGYWFINKPDAVNRQVADNLVKPSAPIQKADKTATEPAAITTSVDKPAARKAQPVLESVQVAAVPSSQMNPVVVEKQYPDTSDKLSNQLRSVSIAALAKKSIDTTVFMRKAVVYNDTNLTKALAGRVAGVQVRVNGKDFVGGNVQQATKNLPADVLEKIQVVDDYGDQKSKKENTAATAVLNQLAGTRTITGKVTSKDDGQGIPGAVITTSDGSQKITTGVDGTFKITLPANGTLKVTGIGYLTQNIKPVVDKDLKVQLEATNNSLSEVVVTGYGTKAGEDITGTIEKVPAKPMGGTKAYDDYLKKNATAIEGETGTVKVAFTIAPNGAPENIYVVSGKSRALNEKAIKLIEDGPHWIKGTDGKEIRLTIKFHKE